MTQSKEMEEKIKKIAIGLLKMSPWKEDLAVERLQMFLDLNFTPNSECISKEEHDKEIMHIWLHFDSIVNAHLWGDYGFNGREVFKDANKYIDKLKEKYPNNLNSTN